VLKVKKLLIVLLVALFATFAFADKVTVEFWHAMSGDLGKVLQNLVDQFNKENPTIEVKSVYVGNYNALNQKLLATITAYNQGTKSGLPAMAQSYGNWTAKYLYSDVVKALNSYITKDPEMKKAWDTQIYPVFKDIVSWGDMIYAIPFNKSTQVYFYNTDLFDMYGIEPPKTIEEFKEIAKLLTEDINKDGTVDQYGFGVRTIVDDFQIYLYAHNGRFLQHVANGKYKIVLDPVKTKQALETVYYLKKNNLSMFQGGYYNDQFGSGQIAAYMGSIAGKNPTDASCKGKHGWNWAPLPSVDGVPHSPIAGTDLIMFNWVPVEQMDASWKFMKYLLDPVNQAYWAINSGYVPVRRDATQTAQWKAYVATDKKPVIALNSLEGAVADPNPAAWNDIRSELAKIFTDMIYDKVSIDDAYTRIYNALETLLKESDELAK